MEKKNWSGIWHSSLYILVALAAVVLAISAAFLAFGSGASTSTVSTTSLPTTTAGNLTSTATSAPASGSGMAAGTQYYYASDAGYGNVSVAPSSGTSFICEASAACNNGIKNYSWTQDASDMWCDTYGHCGEFDSIGHQSSSPCSLGIVDCPNPDSQPEAVGAMGIETTASYASFKSVSSPLSYTVSNATSMVAIMVSCVQGGNRPCSVPNVPPGCTMLFMSSYGNENSSTLGPVSVYGAVCSQEAGSYTISVQNFTYYAAAAYVYGG